VRAICTRVAISALLPRCPSSPKSRGAHRNFLVPYALLPGFDDGGPGSV